MFMFDFLRYLSERKMLLFCCYASGNWVMPHIDGGGFIIIPLMLLSWALLASVVIPVVSDIQRAKYLNPMAHYQTALATGYRSGNFSVNQRQAFRIVCMIVFWTLCHLALTLLLKGGDYLFPDYIWPHPAMVSFLSVFSCYAFFQTGISIVFTVMHAGFATKGIFYGRKMSNRADMKKYFPEK